MKRLRLALLLLSFTAQRWWKGNLHTHSPWSDGNDFPEMIAGWYKENGWNFLALSDHNILSDHELWIKTSRPGAGMCPFPLAPMLCWNA